MLLPLGATAQTLTSSVNTYSPYSMYGLGELSTPGTTMQRSMGGVGAAMFSTTSVNMLNPAAFANTPRQSFLFNFEVEGGHFQNEQNKYSAASSSKVKTAFNTINIHNISFQMPLAQGVGLGFSLSPYSSVGYTMRHDDMAIVGQSGSWRYEYMGEGDVTEVKLGVGWAPVKKFSFGASLLYYWGNIDRSYKSTLKNNITGSGEYSSTTGLDTYDVSRFKAQVGVMWNPILKTDKILSLGATYDLGGALKPKMVKKVYVDNLLTSVVREESEALPLRIPQQLTVGVFFQNLKIKVGADYVWQRWGNDNDTVIENHTKGVEVAYTDTHTVKVGFQYTPRHTDVRNYLNRVAYRVGARYGDYYQTYGGEKIQQLALTAGFGFPVQLFGRSSVDVGIEYGVRGMGGKTIMADDVKVGLVKQQYIKFSIGLSLFGEDEWFMMRKYK